ISRRTETRCRRATRLRSAACGPERTLSVLSRAMAATTSGFISRHSLPSTRWVRGRDQTYRESAAGPESKNAGILPRRGGVRAGSVRFSAYGRGTEEDLDNALAA